MSGSSASTRRNGLSPTSLLSSPGKRLPMINVLITSVLIIHREEAYHMTRYFVFTDKSASSIICNVETVFINLLLLFSDTHVQRFRDGHLHDQHSGSLSLRHRQRQLQHRRRRKRRSTSEDSPSPRSTADIKGNRSVQRRTQGSISPCLHGMYL